MKRNFFVERSGSVCTFSPTSTMYSDSLLLCSCQKYLLGTFSPWKRRGPPTPTPPTPTPTPPTPTQRPWWPEALGVSPPLILGPLLGLAAAEEEEEEEEQIVFSPEFCRRLRRRDFSGSCCLWRRCCCRRRSRPRQQLLQQLLLLRMRRWRCSRRQGSSCRCCRRFSTCRRPLPAHMPSRREKRPR